MSFCSTYLLQGQKINRWFPSNIIYKKQQLQREQVKQNYVWSINTTKWKITDMFSFILHKVIHVPSYKHQIPYMQIPWKYSTSPVDLPRLSRFYFLAFYYSPIASGFTGLETSACPMIILSDVSHDNKLSRTKANSPYKTDPHGKGRALLSQCHGQASGKGMRSICRSLSGPVSRPARHWRRLQKRLHAGSLRTGMPVIPGRTLWRAEVQEEEETANHILAAERQALNVHTYFPDTERVPASRLETQKKGSWRKSLPKNSHI